MPAEPPQPSAAARQVLADLAEQLRKEVAQAHAQGVPYATLIGDRVIWIHPDGSRRLGMEPGSPLFQD